MPYNDTARLQKLIGSIEKDKQDIKHSAQSAVRHLRDRMLSPEALLSAGLLGVAIQRKFWHQSQSQSATSPALRALSYIIKIGIYILARGDRLGSSFADNARQDHGPSKDAA